MAQTRSTQKKQPSKPAEQKQSEESQTPSGEQNEDTTKETENPETEAGESTSSENTSEEAAEGPETGDEGQGGPTDQDDASKPAEAKGDAKDRVSNGGVPKGKIIPVGGEVEFEAHEEGPVLVVDEDVFQEVNLPHTKRKSYVLIHRKGKHLPTRSLRKKG